MKIGRGVNKLTIFSKDTVLVGDLAVEGDLRVDGSLTGDIYATGKIISGDESSIKGNVYAKEIYIYNHLTGNLQAEKVSLENTARVRGNISSKRLHISLEAFFEGESRKPATFSPMKKADITRAQSKWKSNEALKQDKLSVQKALPKDSKSESQHKGEEKENQKEALKEKQDNKSKFFKF